jgi:hypothetical protein
MIPENLQDIYIQVLKRRCGIKVTREGNIIFVWLAGPNRVKRGLFARPHDTSNFNESNWILRPR